MKHGVRHLADRKGIIKIYGSRVGSGLNIFIEDLSNENNLADGTRVQVEIPL